MEDKLVTIAIHQSEKANIAKQLLENRGILVVVDEIKQYLPQGEISLGYHIKVRPQDVSIALTTIGTSKALSYTDKGVFKLDDGRGRILVAVDFSEYSIKACKVAFDLAKLTNSKVKILNVFPNLRYPLHMPFSDIARGDQDQDGNIIGKARNNMLGLCQEINDQINAGEFPSVNYSYSLREGIVEEEIEDFIEEYRPLLLVIGTKGATNNPKHFVGNVTADIIEITDVPVLAVPLESKSSLTDINHIGYLTNVDKRDLQSFDLLVNHMQNYGSRRITLIHINYTSKGGRFNEQQLEDMREYFQLRYPELNIGYKLIDSENPMEAIEDFVDKENVGLICMNTRKRNILGRIFKPSMSRKVLKTIDIPLVILRDRQ